LFSVSLNRIILVGRTGGGKSTLGNKLLAREDVTMKKLKAAGKTIEDVSREPSNPFLVGGTQSMTKFCQLAIGKCQGRNMTVFD
jgi:ABC-type oligopeptide transport system ATPase subunit